VFFVLNSTLLEGREDSSY